MNKRFNRLDKIIKSTVFGSCLLIAIIVVQLIVMVIFAGKKSNYYIDEMFSLGYAHTYIHPKEDVVYINYSKVWENEKWIGNAALKKQLETTEEDSIFALPPSQALRRLAFRRNYMGILNILMSFFAPGKLTAYPAIAFNLIIFVLTQLLLYRISRGLGCSYELSLLAIAMYGFSAIAIGLSLYIRFYAWVIFLLTALLRIHQKMWSEEKLYMYEIWTIVSLVLMYFALKNSELVFVFAGALVGLYALGILMERRWKQAIAYIGTIVPLSLLYAVKRTTFIDIILHPANYTGFEGPTGWMTRDMLSMSMGKFMYFVRLYKRWLDEQLMGSRYVTFGFLIIFLLLLEVRMLRRKKNKHAEGSKDAEITQQLKHKSRFIWIIIGVELVYLMFCFLTCLPATRYVSFLFPFFSVLLWTGISRMLGDQNYRSAITIGCAVLTLIGILSGLFHPGRIEYVYAEDRPLIDLLDAERIKDAIVVYSNEEDATHVVYDCVNLMPDEARIYPVQEEHHSINADETPNDLLIWIKSGDNIRPCTDDLDISGYQIDWFGKTHVSDVYIAHR